MYAIRSYYGFGGGCTPAVTTDFTTQTLAYCTSQDIVITWTIEDLCGSTDVTATYSYTAPTAVTFDPPADDSSAGCEFDAVDVSTAEAALNADLAAWVAAQTTAVEGSFGGGCTPAVTTSYNFV